MDLNKIWVVDPKDGKPSVSLTLVVISFLICGVSIALEITDVTKETSMSFELFGAACGLYWGRKWTSSKGQGIE
jgi:hypothetical protein